MKRQTRLLMLLFAFSLVVLPRAMGQSYTVRFAPGTERIDRGRGSTGRNLDELSTLISTNKPRLEGGVLAVRLTALQDVTERQSARSRELALQQALALKDYLEEACCLGEGTVFDIHVDARTDLNNRVIAELIAYRPARSASGTTSVARAVASGVEDATPSGSSSATTSASVATTTGKTASASPSSSSAYRAKGVGVGLSSNILTFSGVAVNSPLYSPAPNLAAELYFCCRFSTRLSLAYALPYKKGDKENVFDLFSLSVEPRVWLLNGGRFSGLYAGVYGQYGTFDVRIREKLADNCQGSFVGAGLSLGWLQPLWKGLYAEAGLRVGYRSDVLDVYEYTPGEPYRQLAPYTLESFTLQGIDLSIGYRF